MFFAAIIATRNGTEGSNSHVCMKHYVIATVKMSGNRLVGIVTIAHQTFSANVVPFPRHS